jgi:hypothetical protein
MRPFANQAAEQASRRRIRVGQVGILMLSEGLDHP